MERQRGCPEHTGVISSLCVSTESGLGCVLVCGTQKLSYKDAARRGALGCSVDAAKQPQRAGGAAVPSGPLQ